MFAAPFLPIIGSMTVTATFIPSASADADIGHWDTIIFRPKFGVSKDHISSFKSSAKRKSIPKRLECRIGLSLPFTTNTKQRRQFHPDPQSKGIAMQQKEKVPSYTCPIETIFFRKWFLYSPIVPSHRRTVLFSHTMISLAILSSNL